MAVKLPSLFRKCFVVSSLKSSISAKTSVSTTEVSLIAVPEVFAVSSAKA